MFTAGLTQHSERLSREKLGTSGGFTGEQWNRAEVMFGYQTEDLRIVLFNLMQNLEMYKT